MTLMILLTHIVFLLLIILALLLRLNSATLIVRVSLVVLM